MKKIHFCFYKEYKRTTVTKSIYLAQKYLQGFDEDISKLIHVEVYIDGTSYTSSMNSNGVRKRERNFPFEESWEILSFDVENRDAERIKQFFESQMGKGYDYLNIVLNQVFNVNTQLDNKWICSEICFEAAKIGKIITPEWTRMVGMSPAALYSHLLYGDINKGKRNVDIKKKSN